MDDLTDVREMYNAAWGAESTKLQRHQLEADITRRYLDRYLPSIAPSRRHRHRGRHRAAVSSISDSVLELTPFRW